MLRKFLKPHLQGILQVSISPIPTIHHCIGDEGNIFMKSNDIPPLFSHKATSLLSPKNGLSTKFCSMKVYTHGEEKGQDIWPQDSGKNFQEE